MGMDWAAHRRDVHHMGRVQSYLKPIVYGGNDGIVTTFAIVAGFTGAVADGVAEIGAMAVLVFGLANLFADAVSMGLGEFLSARSQRDLYMAKRAEELQALRTDPEGELRELRQILEERGMPPDAIAEAAPILLKSKEITADLMMSYEFGLPDARDETPGANGLSTFLSFIAFGAVPLLPYFVLMPGPLAFRLSLGCTGAALVALGLLRGRATGEGLLRPVAETVLVGALAATVAYVVGALVGG